MFSFWFWSVQSLCIVLVKRKRASMEHSNYSLRCKIWQGVISQVIGRFWPDRLPERAVVRSGQTLLERRTYAPCASTEALQRRSFRPLVPQRLEANRLTSVVVRRLEVAERWGDPHFENRPGRTMNAPFSSSRSLAMVGWLQDGDCTSVFCLVLEQTDTASCATRATCCCATVLVPQEKTCID